MLSENLKASSLSPAERTLMIACPVFQKCIRLVMFSGRKILGNAFRRNGRQAERVLDVGQVVDLLGHLFLGDVAVRAGQARSSCCSAELGIHLLLGLVKPSVPGEFATASLPVRKFAIPCAMWHGMMMKEPQEIRCDGFCAQIHRCRGPFEDKRTVLRLGNDVLRTQDESL